MKVYDKFKKCAIWAKEFFCKNFFSVIVGLALIVLLVMIWKLHEIQYKDIVETVKISVTVLISMLGFSVSIYVFLNNTFQSRRLSNELEKEIIDLFQSQKKIHWELVLYMLLWRYHLNVQ